MQNIIVIWGAVDPHPAFNLDLDQVRLLKTPKIEFLVLQKILKAL